MFPFTPKGSTPSFARWLNAGIALVCLCLASVSSGLLRAGEGPDQKPLDSSIGDAASSESEAKVSNASNSETTRPGKISDPADLEAFFDGAIYGQLKAKNIAGGVVAVVANGKLVFSKGYGYANVETRQKVDPEKTKFRIGSITKLFTWTAVMQQVEEGKLDLDADVNSYLSKLKIPATYPEPITLKHLMAHTPGFEDSVIGLFSHSAEGVLPLEQVLREQMPMRVRLPGVLPSYSNYGSAIAGYAVACVSGLSWEDYIEQRILAPLKMEHTLVRQPATQDLPADLSQGYRWAAGQFHSKPFEYIPPAPAGCISTTANDAANFMIAHLKDGELGSARILKTETAQQMHEPLYRPDPKTSANCHGFMETIRNGERLIGHGGATICFHSEMQLLPDRGVGVFTSFNTDTAGPVNHEILTSFLDRYYPVPVTPRPKSIAGFSDRAKSVAGEYMSTRYSHSSVTKLAALLGVIRVVVNNDDETITISTLDHQRRFAEVEPLVFQQLDGTWKIVFQEGVNGRIDSLFCADMADFAATRSEWRDSIFLHGGILLACTLLFVSAIVIWPVVAFTADGLRAFSIYSSGMRGLLTVHVWLQSVVCLGFLIAVIVVMSDPTEIVFGISPHLKLVLLVPQVCAVLSGLSIFACMIAWLHGYWYFPERLHFTLVALAGIALTWFLHYWNLLNFGK
jgi:CubicO group peptidase (beta-lactamase class C family)